MAWTVQGVAQGKAGEKCTLSDGEQREGRSPGDPHRFPQFGELVEFGESAAGVVSISPGLGDLSPVVIKV